MNELSNVPTALRKIALDRFHLLQPHLEQNRPLRHVAAEAEVPFRTAQRWVGRYQKFGLIGLARGKRADLGGSRTVSLKLRKAIEGLALERPPLPVAALRRQAQQLARTIGEQPPSYWTVRRLVRRLPSDLVTLAHEGTKAYSETFELIHRREADRPNAVWQADHTPLDMLLLRPVSAPV